MSHDDADGQQRDSALAAYAVIGAPPRPELQALAELAAQVAGVHRAAVTLSGSGTEHHVATAGFDGDDVPDDATLCGAHPLLTPAGVEIGTLSVYGTDPRPATPEVDRGLALLADRVVDALELELASRRLAEADARLGTSHERLAHFAGQVSHDLKNPLTSLSLSLEVLELEVTDPYQVDTLARARRGVDRMNDLIGNLLAYASEGATPGDDLVDLDAELAHALDDLTGRVSRDDVEAGELPTARGDATQLRSVLVNLLDNAAKFTPDGEQPEIEVAAETRGGRHRIEVRDRGRGIPADKTERVFAPLARLDKSIEGSGMGLATCRRTVEAHGGTMGVEERDGGGSVFWFELPAVEGAHPAG
ncbi:MAG TPA: HAMP domain-containing sensor histidine kinase [Nocardioides sp.]